MNSDINTYNTSQSEKWWEIIAVLNQEFDQAFADGTSKIFHRNPAWFLNENPIVGYYIPAKGDRVRIMFWSGQSFDEPGLEPEGSFKAATKDYMSVDGIDITQLHKWLEESRNIQWDYKNIVKNKGVLNKIGG